MEWVELPRGYKAAEIEHQVRACKNTSQHLQRCACFVASEEGNDGVSYVAHSADAVIINLGILASYFPVDTILLQRELVS